MSFNIYFCVVQNPEFYLLECLSSFRCFYCVTFPPDSFNVFFFSQSVKRSVCVNLDTDAISWF